MIKSPTVIRHALVRVFANKLYLLFALLLSLSFFFLFIYIPVRNIPGNDFAFQLSILTPTDFLLLIALSLLTTLSLIMNLYLFLQRRKKQIGIALFSQGGVGIFSGTIASIFGTATCAACVGSLFGFLGVGGVFFLLEYRTPITILAIILLLISLYFTAQKVEGVCKVYRS